MTRFKTIANNYERRIHLTSDSISEYLSKMERLKEMLSLALPTYEATSSNQLLIRKELIDFIKHLQPILNERCSENPAIKKIFDELFTSTKKPLKELIQNSKNKSKDNYSQVFFRTNSIVALLLQ